MCAKNMWACAFLFRALKIPSAPAAFLSVTDGPASHGGTDSRTGASIYGDFPLFLFSVRNRTVSRCYAFPLRTTPEMDLLQAREK